MQHPAVQPGGHSSAHCNAGDLRRQGLGMHTDSTSSLQYTHEEGVNGTAAHPHPAHVRTASVADSGDETAHTAGVLLIAVWSHVQQPDAVTRQLHPAKYWQAMFTAVTVSSCAVRLYTV